MTKTTAWHTVKSKLYSSSPTTVTITRDEPNGRILVMGWRPKSHNQSKGDRR